MNIIAITNQKGGVGKTTTAINLSAGLGKLKKKVLLIDLDPQSNSTVGLGIDSKNINFDVFDVLVNDEDINKSILTTTAENVDIIPSSINLAGAEIYLSAQEKDDQKLFEKHINKIEDDYDYIIMDCPPSLGLINRNALSVSNEVIIPVQAEYYALEGLTQLLSTIVLIKKMFNSKLSIAGILITMFDSRTNLAREVEQEIKKFFKEKVFQIKIPRTVSLAEAPSSGLSIFDYKKSSLGAQSYMSLAKEVKKITE